MIIVDLDDLGPEALAQVVQGSRQGLFQGSEVYQAIRDRLIRTLKGDQDLKRLEEEAAQQIAELATGDESVRRKLDLLIDEHHVGSRNIDAGQAEGGDKAKPDSVAFGKNKQQEVVVKGLLGSPATEPVLVTDPPGASIRIQPDTERTLILRSEPTSEWSTLEAIEVRSDPEVTELKITTEAQKDSAKITILFEEPEEFDEEEYPVITTFKAFAKFKGRPEVRLVDRKVVVNRKSPPPPPKAKPVLTATPTILRVASRQPVQLVAGGVATHVRLRWDGLDSLAVGEPPTWQFRARCQTLGSFPPITFSRPNGGKFELLLDAPHGLLPKQTLDFEVEAVGPAGNTLRTTFKGVITPPPAVPEPRKLRTAAPESAGARRPPYELKYVKEADWPTTPCWNNSGWTKDDVGCFADPTDTAPLTLLINQDAESLKLYRDEMLQQKLVEATIEDRQSRYTAHVAFHLYQLYGYCKELQDRNVQDDSIHVLDDGERRAEINRVAMTILKLMKVSGH
jgi:hypothetical protein